MAMRAIPWALIFASVSPSTAEVVSSQAGVPDAPPSFAAVEVSREYRYRVDGRARPLLFWIGKSNIGDGRLTWRRGPRGEVGYELLVGSDPARAPRKINRWGYLREESGDAGAVVFGIMSSSDEQSVDDAERSTRQAGNGRVFKALRQVVTGSEARLTLFEVSASSDLTYAGLDTLLAAVPAAPAKTRTVTIASWNSPGFLAGAASLIEREYRAAATTASDPRVTRVYPYNGRLYELQLRCADRLKRYVREGTSYGPAIRGEFRIVNRATGDETPFTVIFGVEGDLAGVPMLISWRPRWWLEIACVLRRDGHP